MKKPRSATFPGPGTIGVIANDSARYTCFTASLCGLEKPTDTVIQWAISSDIVLGRNQLAETMKGDWIWFIDDDHAFAPDLLLRLLAHNLPVVTPLCFTRAQPFYPVCYSGRIDGELQSVRLSDHPNGGLIEVEAAGTAGMLIRKKAMREIELPWFSHGGTSEDIIFSDRLRAAGIPIHTDLNTRLGHATTVIVWPWNEEQEWSVGFSIADNYRILAAISE